MTNTQIDLTDEEKIRIKRKRDLEHNRKYRLRYPGRTVGMTIKSHKKTKQERPWVIVYWWICARCNCKSGSSYKYYGGRGIKCLITKDELKELWHRDKAYEMESPSIDRIDSAGDYTMDNCRFIEKIENTRRGNQEKWRRYYELHGKSN